MVRSECWRTSARHARIRLPEMPGKPRLPIRTFSPPGRTPTPTSPSSPRPKRNTRACAEAGRLAVAALGVADAAAHVIGHPPQAAAQPFCHLVPRSPQTRLQGVFGDAEFLGRFAG